MECSIGVAFQAIKMLVIKVISNVLKSHLYIVILSPMDIALGLPFEIDIEKRFILCDFLVKYIVPAIFAKCSRVYCVP